VDENPADLPRSNIGIRDLIAADLRGMAAYQELTYPSLSGFIGLLSEPGVWATALFRLADWLHRRRLRPMSRLLFFANFVLFNTELFPGADIGPGLVLPHPVGVAVVKGAVVGRDFHAIGAVRIGGGAAENSADDGFPHVGDDCWMLDGAKAFGPIRIGDATIITASSVVLADLPSRVVAAGIPARVVEQRDGHTTYVRAVALAERAGRR